jgi:hypothetical protein
MRKTNGFPVEKASHSVTKFALLFITVATPKKKRTIDMSICMLGFQRLFLFEGMLQF